MNARGTTLPHFRTLRQAVALVGLLAAAVAVLLLGHADRADATPTCTRYWTGASSTAWGTAANWSNTDGGAASTVPGGTDFACMSTAPTRQTLVVSDARSVAGFSFPSVGSVNPILQLTGTGNLTVGTSAVDSYASAVKTLTLAFGSTFGGRADVTAGTIGSLSGVILDGSGSLTLDTGGNGLLASGTGLEVHGDYDLVNKGTLTFNNATIYLYDGTVVNQGTWTWKNPSNYPIYNWTDDAGNLATNAAGGIVDVAPASAADTTTLGDMPIVNNGTLKVTRGTLTTSVGGSGTGTYNLIPAASTFNMNGGTFDVAGASLTGAGTFSLNSGTMTGSPTAAAKVSLNGGTLAGGGSMSFPAGSTVDITSAGVSLDGSTDVVNNGTLTSNDGTVYLYDGTFTNAGTWTWKNPTNTPIYNWTDLATNVVTNASGGTVDVAPANSSDVTSLSDMPIVNSGTLKVSKGTLATYVGGSGTGTYNLLTGTTLDVDGGTFDIGGADVTGQGTLNLNSNGIVTGTGTVASNMGLHGGVMSGIGTLTLAPAALTTLPSADVVWLQDTYKVSNQGTFNQSGQIVLMNDPNLENSGTWALTMTGSALNNWDALAKDPLVNKAAGVLTSAPGAANTVDLGGVRVTNQGELRALSGTTNVSLTNLTAGGVMNGGTLTAQGGTLGLNANLVTNGGTVTVVTGGIDNTSTATSALPSLRTNNGTLTLSQSVTGTGPVTNTGTVWLKSGTFQPTTYTQTAGSTRFDAPAVLKGGGSGTGAVAINGGSLTGGGAVQGPVTNAGLVQPGGNGTPLSVTGTYTQTGAGTFAAVVNGTTTVGTDYSKLTSTGAATLTGTLTIQTGASLNPPVGTSVRILSAASRSGTFSTITGRDTLPAGKYWGVGYDATGVTLTVMQDPAASVGSASVAEGNSGTTTLGLTVTLDQAGQRTVTYDYTTVGVTATAPSDYTEATGSLVFAPGETTKTVNVTVNGDTTFEPNETLKLHLSTPAGANGTIAANDGIGTITNDDPPPPAITVTAVSPNVLGQGATAQPLTVTGTGFDPTSNITFAKPGITKVAGTQTFVNATTMTVTVNVSATATLGPMNVSVAGTNGTATCTNCFTVTAKPVATAATPALGGGAKNREVTITGSGFQPGATVVLSGVNVMSTSFIDANTIETLVSVPVNRPPGTSTVTVTNPDRGKSLCTGCFSTLAPPTVSGMSQTSFARGTTVSVTVTGSNLGPGVKLVGPTGIVFDGVVRVNDTTVTATAFVASNAPLGGGKTLTVVNPGSRGYGQATLRPLVITT